MFAKVKVSMDREQGLGQKPVSELCNCTSLELGRLQDPRVLAGPKVEPRPLSG